MGKDATPRGSPLSAGDASIEHRPVESRQNQSAPTPVTPHDVLGLSPDTLLEMYWYMILSRTLDQRGWLLHRQGRIPFHISAMGHEAAQVGSTLAFRRGTDWFNPYYRGVATALAAGTPPAAIMKAYYGKADDPSSGGRQMPGHYGYRPLNIVAGSSSVGTQIPQAVGMAWAARYLDHPVVVHVSFGDGATSKGDFHEGMNFAGIHQVPCVLICENNQYAISVPLPKQMPTATIAERAAAYGMPGIRVDGNDILEVYRVTKEAVDRAREGGGPTLIECLTYRVVPHSSDDDDRTYRSREEVEAWKQRDPVDRFRRYLQEHTLLTEETDREMRARAEQAAEDAIAEAEAAPDPAPEDALIPVWAHQVRPAPWKEAPRG